MSDSTIDLVRRDGRIYASVDDLTAHFAARRETWAATPDRDGTDVERAASRGVKAGHVSELDDVITDLSRLEGAFQSPT